MKAAKHYDYPYFTPFICAILIVIIHSGRLTNNPGTQFLLKSMLCRLAVLFLIVNNACFYRHKSSQQKKNWLLKTSLLYLFWSVIYLPFGSQFIQVQLNLPLVLYPFALIVRLFYIYFSMDQLTGIQKNR